MNFNKYICLIIVASTFFIKFGSADSLPSLFIKQGDYQLELKNYFLYQPDYKEIQVLKEIVIEYNYEINQLAAEYLEKEAESNLKALGIKSQALNSELKKLRQDKVELLSNGQAKEELLLEKQMALSKLISKTNPRLDVLNNDKIALEKQKESVISTNKQERSKKKEQIAADKKSLEKTIEDIQNEILSLKKEKSELNASHKDEITNIKNQIVPYTQIKNDLTEKLSSQQKSYNGIFNQVKSEIQNELKYELNETNRKQVMLDRVSSESSFYDYKLQINNRSDWDIKSINIKPIYKSKKGDVGLCENVKIVFSSSNLFSYLSNLCERNYDFNLGETYLGLNEKHFDKGINIYKENVSCIRSKKRSKSRDIRLPGEISDLRAWESLTGGLYYDKNKIMFEITDITFAHPMTSSEQHCREIDFEETFKEEIKKKLDEHKTLGELRENINKIKRDLEIASSALDNSKRETGNLITSKTTLHQTVSKNLDEKLKNLENELSVERAAYTLLSAEKNLLPSYKNEVNRIEKDISILVAEKAKLENKITNDKITLEEIRKSVNQYEIEAEKLRERESFLETEIASNQKMIESFENVSESISSDLMNEIFDKLDNKKTSQIWEKTNNKLIAYLDNIEFKPSNDFVKNINKETVLVKKELIRYGNFFAFLTLDELNEKKEIFFENFEIDFKRIQKIN